MNVRPQASVSKKLAPLCAGLSFIEFTCLT
nr:MAG TPA: hypothetical protein [Caudoviricetes sp.]